MRERRERERESTATCCDVLNQPARNTQLRLKALYIAIMPRLNCPFSARAVQYVHLSQLGFSMGFSTLSILATFNIATSN